jgi:hypothetical protein
METAAILYFASLGLMAIATLTLIVGVTLESNRRRKQRIANKHYREIEGG